MNLASLVTLLQLVLALLSNPAATQNQQLQALANQAIAAATASLSQLSTNAPSATTTTPLPTSQPTSSISFQVTTSTMTVAPTTNSVSVPTSTYTTSAFSVSPLGAISNRAKSASDALAALVLVPAGGGSIALNVVRITFTGSAGSSTSFPTATTCLLGGTPSSFTSKIPATISTYSGGKTIVEWDLGTGTAGLAMSGPTTLTLVADTTNTNVAGAGNSVSLYANIQTLSDIQYTDGTSGNAASGIGLPGSILVPIQLNGVQFQTNS